MANIKVRQNGPYLVEGDDVTVVDWNGKPYQIPEAAVRAVPMRRLDEQAVLRRHPFEDRLPGGRGRCAGQPGQAGILRRKTSTMPRTFPVMLAGFAAFLDLYSTQPLLPLLARTFHASSFAVSLTITAPTLAVAIAAPWTGRLSDSFGLRKVIVGSAAALAVATLLAATARDLRELIAWRFAQGLATPGLFASAIAYIHEEWPPSHVGRATAAYVSGTVIGGVIGRLAGRHRGRRRELGCVVRAARLLSGAVAAAAVGWLPPEAAEPASVAGKRPGKLDPLPSAASAVAGHVCGRVLHALHAGCDVHLRAVPSCGSAFLAVDRGTGIDLPDVPRRRGGDPVRGPRHRRVRSPRRAWSSLSLSARAAHC